MQTINIEVPITELDIEQFKELIYQDSEPFTWVFESDTQGIEVEVTFVKDKE